MTGDEAPTYPSEFIGWRGWLVKDGYLLSVNGGEIWLPGQEFVAECSNGRPHSHVPWKSCTCGIYTVKTLKKLRANGYHDFGAFGQVAVWGHVIDGGMGYRSEFAYPKVIYLPYLSWRLEEALTEYGVPVLPLNPHTGEPA